MQKEEKILGQNKKAFVLYEILEKLETGVVLSGSEVKSLRAGHVNLKGSFIEINDKDEVYTRNVHISGFKKAPSKTYDPLQKRKLLLHKEEIQQLKKQLENKGITIVPLDFHLNRNRIKMTIAICRGKKKHDRREDLKKKAQNLEIRRTLKKYH